MLVVLSGAPRGGRPSPPDPGPAALDGLLRQVVDTAAGGYGQTAWAVIVVDQLEELFTVCESEDERGAFISSRRRAVSTGDGGGWWWSRRRADFYGRCARYPQLRESLVADQVLVGPMSPGELSQAIVCPAQARRFRSSWAFPRYCCGTSGLPRPPTRAAARPAVTTPAASPACPCPTGHLAAAARQPADGSRVPGHRWHPPGGGDHCRACLQPP